MILLFKFWRFTLIHVIWWSQIIEQSTLITKIMWSQGRLNESWKWVNPVFILVLFGWYFGRWRFFLKLSYSCLNSWKGSIWVEVKIYIVQGVLTRDNILFSLVPVNKKEFVLNCWMRVSHKHLGSLSSNQVDFII